MGLMDKYNKGGVTFDIDIKDFTFVDLKSLSEKFSDGEVFKIDGLYINKKSSFGDHPVAIMVNEKLLADLPAHLNEDVKEILSDPEAVEAIKAGHVGFTIHKYYQEKFKKDCYGIRWEDIA